MKGKITSLVKRFLSNKYVLYLVFFAALFEILALLTIKDYDSLGLFMVIGLLASYFTKNMTMILITAMAFTNCRVCSNLLNRSTYILEGFKEGANHDKKKHKTPPLYWKSEKGDGDCEKMDKEHHTKCSDDDVKCFTDKKLP